MNKIKNNTKKRHDNVSISNTYNVNKNNLSKKNNETKEIKGDINTKFQIKDFADIENPLLHKIYFYAGISVIACVVITLWWISLLHHETSVLDQRMYDSIRKAQSLFEEDPLVLQTENFKKENYEKNSIILIPFLSIFSAEQTILIVMILCLIIAGISYSLLEIKRPLYLILLAVTPAIITTFATFSDYSVALCIGLLSLVLFHKNKDIAGILTTITCSIFNPWIAMGIISFLLFQKTQKDSKSPSFIYLLIGLICVVGVFTTIHMQITQLSLSFENIFTELGGIYGISIILLFLGGIRYGEQALKKPPLFILCIPIIISFFIDLRASVLIMCIILGYFASEILEYLLIRNWENDLVKKISLLAIILTFSFSALTHSSVLIQNQTTIISHPVLPWIKESTPEYAIIVSYPGHGYVIKYTSNRTILADEEMTQIYAAKERIEDLNNLFNTRNKETAYGLLNKYGAHYILITEEMRENGIWNKPDEGLLFLLKNDNAFRHIYSDDKADVYYYSNFDYSNQSSKKIILPRAS